MQVIKKNYVKPAQKDENAEVSGVKMTTHISQLILICGFFFTISHTRISYQNFD